LRTFRKWDFEIEKSHNEHWHDQKPMDHQAALLAPKDLLDPCRITQKYKSYVGKARRNLKLKGLLQQFLTIKAIVL